MITRKPIVSLACIAAATLMITIIGTLLVELVKERVRPAGVLHLIVGTGAVLYVVLSLRLWMARLLAERGVVSERVSKLFASGNYFSNWRACEILSILCGNRYGLTSPQAVQLWREWWAANCTNLVWVGAIDRLVEREVAERRSYGPFQN